MLRAFILIILGLGTTAWLSLVTVLLAHSNPMGEGIVIALVAIPSAVFLVFALPAFILALKRSSLGLALALALLSLVSLALVA